MATALLRVHYDTLGQTYRVTVDMKGATFIANLPAEKVERFERVQREWDEMQDELWDLHTDAISDAP